MGGIFHRRNFPGGTFLGGIFLGGIYLAPNVSATLCGEQLLWASLEHLDAKLCDVRGVLGGALFGAMILGDVNLSD